MNLLLTLNNMETTNEQNEALNAEIKKAQIKAIKIMKNFAEMILALPDEFELDQKTLDELLKPLTEDMYGKVIENDSCLQDITSSVDLIGVILHLSLTRCKNQTKTLLSELYKIVLGQYEPENEMPISQIIYKLKELQPK